PTPPPAKTPPPPPPPTPTIVNPPAPATVTPLQTTTIIGYDPTKDWASGVIREDSFLRDSDLTTIKKGTGTGAGTLLFSKGNAVTWKSASGDWVEVEGSVREKKPGKSSVAAGTARGWIQ